MEEKEPSASASSNNAKLVYCGLVSGVLQAGVFSPWDRALYLALIHDRSFLDINNFRNPWAGVLTNLVQRTLSGGLYFPLEDIFRGLLGDVLPEDSSAVKFIAGMLAGGTNGIVLNPASTVRYRMWGAPQDLHHRGFLDTARAMHSEAGLRVFLTGTVATLYRDLLFGGVYGYLRFALAASAATRVRTESDIGPLSLVTSSQRYVINMFSACTATFLSSPLNYVRNMQYAAPPGLRPRAGPLLLELWAEAQRQGGVHGTASFLQRRLRLGWGTARVGVGMAFSEQIYSRCAKAVSATSSL
jgi:hypothetical protein